MSRTALIGRQLWLLLSVLFGTIGVLAAPESCLRLWELIPPELVSAWPLICLTPALLGGNFSRGELLIMPGAILLGWSCSVIAYRQWLTGASLGQFLSRELSTLIAFPAVYGAYSAGLSRVAVFRRFLQLAGRRDISMDLLFLFQLLFCSLAVFLFRHGALFR